MADFIRFQADGRPILVNAENITSVFAPIDEYLSDRTCDLARYTPVYSKTRTTINFPGNDDNFIVVDEPFEAVCAKLNGKVQTGTWIEKNVEDDKYDPYGLFKRRFYCSECGEWQTYGMTPYCPKCGKPMSKEAESKAETLRDLEREFYGDLDTVSDLLCQAERGGA